LSPYSIFNDKLIAGAIQTPGSVGWFIAASAKTKIIAKNYSRLALIAEEATKTLVNK
jgi:hypothetical protein